MVPKKSTVKSYIRSVLLALVIAFIAEYSFNIDLDCLRTTVETSNSSSRYSISDAELINCDLNGKLIVSRNSDPQIIFRGIDSYVELVEIRCNELNYSTMPVQIFYAGEENDFDADHCIASVVRCDRRVHYLELNEFVTDIRIDIGNAEGSSYQFEVLKINPGAGDYLYSVLLNMSMTRMIIFFMIALTAALAMTDFNGFTMNLHKYRLLIGSGVIVIVTLLRIHGSSIGRLAELMQDLDTDLLIGTNRPVRTDEYVAFTEMAISQARSGFKWFSDIWGYSPSDMFIIYGQPVRNIVTLFRPFSIGYLLLGAEMGLSFYWISRIVVGLLVSYEFGRILTKDDRRLSIAYAVLVIFAPVVQWWFSTNEFVEMLIAGQCALLIAHRYIDAKGILKKTILSIGFAFCCGVYVLSLYPAWMIPLAYVFLACFVCIICENRKKIVIHLSDCMIWAATIVLFGLCFTYIYRKSGDTIRAILNTSYPGKRSYNGGPLLNALELFRGWTSYIWSFIDTENPCEEVCFISFFPAGIILSYIAVFRKKIKDLWLILLGAANLLLIAYSVIPMPGIIGSFSLLNKSLNSRIIIVIGFLNLMILIRALYVLWEQDMSIYRTAFAVLSVTSCIISFIALDEKQPAAVKVITLVTGAIFAFLLSDINKLKVKKAFVTYCMILALIGGVMVNPVSVGIGSVINEPQISEIGKINDDNPGTWMTIGTHIFANLPAMVGTDTASALDTYPDEELWAAIGLGDQRDIWNRYANKVIEISDETTLELEQDDLITLYISVEDLRKLSVDYLFSIKDLSEYEELERIYSYSYFDIYKVN